MMGVSLLCAATPACIEVEPDGALDRCEDVTNQIEQALAHNTESGILLPGASPCELGPESFDERVGSSDVEYLIGAFDNACREQAASCGYRERPVPPPPPPPPPGFSNPGPAPVVAH